jgi:hypothetical protein
VLFFPPRKQWKEKQKHPRLKRSCYVKKEHEMTPMNRHVTFEHFNVLNLTKTQRNDVDLITYPHQLSIKNFNNKLHY